MTAEPLGPDDGDRRRSMTERRFFAELSAGLVPSLKVSAPSTRQENSSISSLRFSLDFHVEESERHMPGLWVVLPAIAEAMDDEGISKAKALVKLRQLVSEQPASREMKKTVTHLEAAKSELALRVMLGEECLRLMKLASPQRLRLARS